MAKKLTEELFPDVKARQDNAKAKDIAPKQTPELSDADKKDAVVAATYDKDGEPFEIPYPKTNAAGRLTHEVFQDYKNDSGDRRVIKTGERDLYNGYHPRKGGKWKSLID